MTYVVFYIEQINFWLILHWYRNILLGKITIILLFYWIFIGWLVKITNCWQ